MTTRTFTLGVMAALCVVAQGAAQTAKLQGKTYRSPGEGKKIASRWKLEP